MTAASRVARTRTALAFLAGTVALLWAVAVGAAVLAVMAGLDLVLVLPRGVRMVAWPAALVGSLTAGLAMLWRARKVRSTEAVALASRTEESADMES